MIRLPYLREDAVQILLNDFDEIIDAAESRCKENFEKMRQIGPAALAQRFLDKGTKFGEFDPFAINTSEEIYEECQDIPLYIIIELFKSLHAKEEPEG